MVWTQKTGLARYSLYLWVQREGEDLNSNNSYSFSGQQVKYGPLNKPITVHVLNFE